MCRYVITRKWHKELYVQSDKRNKFCFTFRNNFVDVSDLILHSLFEDFTKHNEYAGPKLQRYLQTVLKLPTFRRNSEHFNKKHRQQSQKKTFSRAYKNVNYPYITCNLRFQIYSTTSLQYKFQYTFFTLWQYLLS